jgi:hypothetical protein
MVDTGFNSVSQSATKCDFSTWIDLDGLQVVKVSRNLSRLDPGASCGGNRRTSSQKGYNRYSERSTVLIRYTRRAIGNSTQLMYRK